MKVKITGDSTCDLPAELCEKYDVGIMPLYVCLGDDERIDGVNITPDDIYDYVEKSKKLPKSASRSADDYEAFFRTYTDEGYEVVHFDISESMSASYQCAVEASKRLSGVYVINSKSLSTGIALLMLAACDLAKEGLSAAEITARIMPRIDSVQASFVVDDMEYLHKGGRCTSLVYLGANLLGIKPCIEVANGKMGVARKYIGRLKGCIRKYVAETLKKFDAPDRRRIFVTHTKMNGEIVDAVVGQIREQGIFEEILETTAGCTVTTHCGAGTLGILYINDGEKITDGE